MRRLLTAAAAALFIFTGCVKYDIGEILLSRTEVSLSLKDKNIYTFDSSKGQFGFNPQRNEYRVVDDDLSSWFVFICDARPGIEGDMVKGSLEWVTRTSKGKREGAVFRVERVGGDGTIWLWCEDEKIGLVIRDI